MNLTPFADLVLEAVGVRLTARSSGELLKGEVMAAVVESKTAKMGSGSFSPKSIVTSRPDTWGKIGHVHLSADFGVPRGLTHGPQ